MIRFDEQMILFPTLARPIGNGRWDAHLHGVLFKPEQGSLKRRLLIRLIARRAGVRHDAIAGPRLAERLAPFLVDNKRRRSVCVQIGDARVVMGPSGADGHLVGRAEIRHAGESGVIEYATVAEESAAARFAGRVHLLARTGLSVISDIDDTIKISCVPDTRELLCNTFVRPYRAVAPILGLHGAMARAGASFHYVSASPWQLYPLLREFLVGVGFPDGTFHLRPFRLKDRSALGLLGPPDGFKIGVIEPILRGWPRRKFVLVGDSAERDPEIYGEIARRFPRQIAAILIRDITGEGPDSTRYRAAMAGVARANWHVLVDDGDWAGLAATVLERGLARERR